MIGLNLAKKMLVKELKKDIKILLIEDNFNKKDLIKALKYFLEKCENING